MTDFMTNWSIYDQLPKLRCVIAAHALTTEVSLLHMPVSLITDDWTPKSRDYPGTC